MVSFVTPDWRSSFAFLSSARTEIDAAPIISATIPVQIVLRFMFTSRLERRAPAFGLRQYIVRFPSGSPQDFQTVTKTAYVDAGGRRGRTSLQRAAKIHDVVDLKDERTIRGCTDRSDRGSVSAGGS